MISYDKAVAAFRQAYGHAPTVFASAPGRINLIGEHVDYADGRVLPVAIQRGVTVAAATAPRGKLRVHSDEYLEVGVVEVTPDEPPPHSYVAFVHALALEAGITGADVVVLSDLPVGRGSSSSAAFALALLGGMLALEPPEDLPVPMDVCRMAQRAEADSLSVDVGVMDQYGSMFGQAGSGVLFDTWMESHELVPVELGDARLVVADSGQPRSLAESAYNRRRWELEQGLDDLKRRVGEFASWRSLDLRQVLDELEHIPRPGKQRVRHIITEHQRVERFVELLATGKIIELGVVLDACHHSLSEDYAVSTPELDALQESLSSEAGIYGARLVGGGFGGSVLALVDAEALTPGPGGATSHLEQALASYQQRIGLTASWMPVEIGDGAQVLPQGGVPLLLRDWLAGPA